MISELIENRKKSGEKIFALLIDPDQHTELSLENVIERANKTNVDVIFVGGSLLNNDIDRSIGLIKANSTIPVILFPGNLLQISNKADAILLLSLISGRNPDLLIGNHVIASSHIKRSKLEVLPTGYILIDGGKPTSVEYMSNTKPIPSDKQDIATATAMAGEMLGLKYIYLEAGSGAKNTINTKMIEAVSKSVNIPLIVGGGLKSTKDIRLAINAGADIVVLGTAIENDISLLDELVKAAHS